LNISRLLRLASAFSLALLAACGQQPPEVVIAEPGEIPPAEQRPGDPELGRRLL
jgi:hypothetical protein